jgi:hypothetical protein
MLPHLQMVFLRRWLPALLVGAGLAGCGSSATPEQQVREVIDAGEAAAESRDLSGMLEHVSASFRDDQGGGREELKQYLRGYLLTHPSVEVLTRVESIEFPYRDYARVQLTVGTLGRGAAGSGTFDLAGDVNEITLELALEGDEWKVVRAAW